jgi:hypothetical protein
MTTSFINILALLSLLMAPGTVVSAHGRAANQSAQESSYNAPETQKTHPAQVEPPLMLAQASGISEPTEAELQQAGAFVLDMSEEESLAAGQDGQISDQEDAASRSGAPVGEAGPVSAMLGAAAEKTAKSGDEGMVIGYRATEESVLRCRPKGEITLQTCTESEGLPRQPGTVPAQGKEKAAETAKSGIPAPYSNNDLNGIYALIATELRRTVPADKERPVQQCKNTGAISFNGKGSVTLRAEQNCAAGPGGEAVVSQLVGNLSYTVKPDGSVEIADPRNPFTPMRGQIVERDHSLLLEGSGADDGDSMGLYGIAVKK